MFLAFNASCRAFPRGLLPNGCVHRKFSALLITWSTFSVWCWYLNSGETPHRLFNFTMISCTMSMLVASFEFAPLSILIAWLFEYEALQTLISCAGHSSGWFFQ